MHQFSSSPFLSDLSNLSLKIESNLLNVASFLESNLSVRSSLADLSTSIDEYKSKAIFFINQLNDANNEMEQSERIRRAKWQEHLYAIEQNYENLRHENDKEMRKVLQKEEEADKKLEECMKREKEESRREERRKEEEKRKEKEIEKILEEERRKRIKAEVQLEKMRREIAEGGFFGRRKREEEKNAEEWEEEKGKGVEKNKHVEKEAEEGSRKVESLFLGDSEGINVLNDSSMIANKLIGSQMKHLLESEIRTTPVKTYNENEISRDEEEEKLSGSDKESELIKTAPIKKAGKLKIMKGTGLAQVFNESPLADRQKETQVKTNLTETKPEKNVDNELNKTKEIENVCESKVMQGNDREILGNSFFNKKTKIVEQKGINAANPFLIDSSKNSGKQERLEKKEEEINKINLTKNNPFLTKAPTDSQSITNIFTNTLKKTKESSLINDNACCSNSICEKPNILNFFGETSILRDSKENKVFHSFNSNKSKLFGDQSEIKKADQLAESNIFLSRPDQYFGKK